MNQSARGCLRALLERQKTLQHSILLTDKKMKEVNFERCTCAILPHKVNSDSSVLANQITLAIYFIIYFETSTLHIRSRNII